MILRISEKLLDMGISASTLLVRDFNNSDIPTQFSLYHGRFSHSIQEYWKARPVMDNPVVARYMKTYAELGFGEDIPLLIRTIFALRKGGDMEGLSLIEQCIRHITGRTLLSVGALDMEGINPPVTLNPDGLFDDKGKRIGKVDLSHLEPIQESKRCNIAILFIWNSLIHNAVGLYGLWLMAEMLDAFGGGKSELIDFYPSVKKDSPISVPKPEVTIDIFKGFEIVTGKITKIEPITGFHGLSRLMVNTGMETSALFPTDDDIVGKTVLVAKGLYPLQVGEESFTSTLLISNSNGDVIATSCECPLGCKVS